MYGRQELVELGERVAEDGVHRHERSLRGGSRWPSETRSPGAAAVLSDPTAPMVLRERALAVAADVLLRSSPVARGPSAPSIAMSCSGAARRQGQLVTGAESASAHAHRVIARPCLRDTMRGHGGGAAWTTCATGCSGRWRCPSTARPSSCPAPPNAPCWPSSSSPRPHHPGHHAGRPAVVGVDAAGRPDERAADPRLQAASRAQGRRASATSSPAKGSATAPPSTRPRSTRSTSPTASAPRAPRPRTLPTAAATSTGHLQAYDDALALWRGDPLSDFADRTVGGGRGRPADRAPAGRDDRTRPGRAGARPAPGGRRRPRASRRPRPDPGVARRAADAGAVPQRPPGRRPRGVHPHPRRSSTSRSASNRRCRCGPCTSGCCARTQSLGAQPELTPPATGRRSPPARRRAPTRTAGARRRTCPPCVRPLIGRDAQLDSLAELLGGVRLLSLIGPGGAGKTSLALATVVRTSARLPRRRVRGAAGVGQHRRPGAARGRRRPRRAARRRRGRPRRARPAHRLPVAPAACCCWSTTASTSWMPPPA